MRSVSPRIQAKSAGVSTVPMWRAVNLLAEEGVLKVVMGSGVLVKPFPYQDFSETPMLWKLKAFW
ncbi:MAG: hypothetical protein ACLFVQ_04815 [Chitinispirillaceae bacterium]